MSQEFFNKLLSAMEQRAIQEGKYIEFLQFMESRRVKSEQRICNIQAIKEQTESLRMGM